MKYSIVDGTRLYSPQTTARYGFRVRRAVLLFVCAP
jgi:hypothetical protein